jgi:hypothetical protein
MVKTTTADGKIKFSVSDHDRIIVKVRRPNLHYARRVSGGSWPDSHVILAGVSLPKVRL